MHRLFTTVVGLQAKKKDRSLWEETTFDHADAPDLPPLTSFAISAD